MVLWELATLQIPWDGVNRHAIRYWVVEKETHLPLVAEGDAIEGATAPQLVRVSGSGLPSSTRGLRGLHLCSASPAVCIEFRG